MHFMGLGLPPCWGGGGGGGGGWWEGGREGERDGGREGTVSNSTSDIALIIVEMREFVLYGVPV